MNKNKIQIILNGKKNILKKNISIYNLIKDIDLDDSKIAIELNGEIIPKSNFKSHIVFEGDCIEIVHFIGGG